ncbi:hypothetical protein CVT26_009575 [Gymnopilus dilepis]|uniref:Uncharacterized protein n=1 Tax=Gymnopilus dilepis TaxID=231916 RepID=A0A409WUJ6_9AGAR|nr:hypothetical protein CVT26_009575 [Gymnopilus dilepis]
MSQYLHQCLDKETAPLAKNPSEVGTKGERKSTHRSPTKEATALAKVTKNLSEVRTEDYATVPH